MKKTFMVASLAACAIAFPGIAAADGTPTPAPAVPAPPGPVINTGGATGGSSPGSGCSMRLGLRNVPPPQSALFLWNQNGDAGWPFGWPGPGPYTAPTTPPVVGCSR